MAHPNELRTPGPLAMLSRMDREMTKRHLLQAEGAVVSGESHIARQKEIVRDMEAKGQDTALAKDLLSAFLALQKEHRAHRDRLLVELGLAH